ncbi:MAG: hydroxymethylbilane synthase, partial [Nitrosopumilus sp.]|nr:hydroxymethylbilane synthase [Nitrosopumilus sp.]
SDVKVKPIRGNIETRIRKVNGENYDAIVLAQAGISRLGVDVKCSALPINDFSPSPGQGAIAIVSRKDDAQTISMLKSIEDPDSRLEIEAERALSDFVDSGCRFPVGAYAKSNGTEMILDVKAFSVDGKKSLHVKKSGDKTNPKSIGKEAGEELRENGVNDLALNWREKVEEWNSI